MSKITSGVSVQDKPERVERVNIEFELDFKAFKRHEKAIRALTPGFTLERMSHGDLFCIDYKFMVDYQGVVESLNAIMELCDDPDVINKLGCKALENERILIYEVLKKLDETIEKVKQRDRT